MSRCLFPDVKWLLCALSALGFVMIVGAVWAGPDPRVSLTPEEEAWLQAHPSIRLGVDPGAPPTEFLNHEGAYLGIASDMVRLIGERLGINCEVVPDLTWSQVIDKARSCEVDVLPCVARTRERHEYLLFTKPYLNVPVVIVTRTDAPYVGGLDDLQGKILAVIRNYQLYERLQADHPSAAFLAVDSTKAALQAVSDGRAFAFPGNLAQIFYLLPMLGISNLKVAAPTPYSFAPCFGIRKDWPELRTILDKALATVSPEERTAISQKWISLDRLYGIDYALVLKWVGAAGVVLAFLVAWNFQIRRQKRIVKESEERLQTILDSIPNVVFVTDLHGRKILVNREWERITKWTRDKAVGKSYEELYPKRLAEKLRDYDGKVMENLTPLKSEEALKTALGPRTFVQSLVPLLDSSGKAYAICGSATDITERKRAEEQLLEAFAESNRLLAEAAHYVKTLLPEPMSRNGITADWRFEPSAALGGDCFGYHWLDDDHFALYLIDVSGHGVSASLLAVGVLNLLRSQTLKETDFYSPGSVLTSLNRAFPMEDHDGMYFTIWYGVYRSSSRTLHYSSGGHPPALLLSRGRDSESTGTHLRTPNIFIGAFPAVEYKTASITVAQDSSLYLFSDGVFEVSDGDGSLWGFSNFETFMAAPSDSKEPLLDRLLDSVRLMSTAPTLEDDFSIVEVEFK